MTANLWEVNLSEREQENGKPNARNTIIALRNWLVLNRDTSDQAEFEAQLDEIIGKVADYFHHSAIEEIRLMFSDVTEYARTSEPPNLRDWIAGNWKYGFDGGPGMDPICLKR